MDARLFELERIYGAALAQAQALTDEEAAADLRDQIRAIIASRGIEQDRSESLFDAFARALGISSMELKAELAQFASGWRPLCHE